MTIVSTRVSPQGPPEREGSGCFGVERRRQAISSARRKGDGPGVLERGARRVEQVRLWVHGAELRGLDEAIEERGDLGPTLGARAVVVLAADD